MHTQHRPLPPLTTPTLSCSVSHGAPSLLRSALRSSASLWSQHKDLSPSWSLTQSVWSTPRCVHLEFCLKRNEIYQTQLRFSWAVVKLASDTDCIIRVNEGSLVIKVTEGSPVIGSGVFISVETGWKLISASGQMLVYFCVQVSFHIRVLFFS